MNLRPSRLATFMAATVLQGCMCNITQDTAPDPMVDTAITDTRLDTDTALPPIEGVNGTINGTVTVSLYGYDTGGNITDVAWEDTCFGDTFPYGDIFVSAYSTDEKTGAETYYADTVLADPETDGALNQFSLTIDTDEVDEIYIYAVLDKWFNRVIEPYDPMGIYAEPIQLQDGETINDVNIEILTEYWCGSDAGSCPDCPPGWGSGGDWYWDGTQWVYTGSGTGCDETVTIGGDLIIDTPYNGVGNVGTFLIYPSTESVWWLVPDIAVTATADGASGEWGFTYCQNAGTYQARGVWDDNDNGLYDPTDTWGQPINDDGEPLGSITFGEVDENLTMLIPVGDSGFELVPFVRISGEISRVDGGWDTLLTDYPDAHVYVVASKYYAEAQVTISDLDDAYDYDMFEPADLGNSDELLYSILTPSNVNIFLYTGADLDNDGVIDAESEGWACGGEDDCWLATGQANISGQNMGIDFSFLWDTGN